MRVNTLRCFRKWLIATTACTIVGILLMVCPSAMAQTTQCTFTTLPDRIEAKHSGGAYTISFTGSGGTCNWSAYSHDDWITISSAAKGAGNGSISITVKPNTGTTARQGRVEFVRKYIWVSQPPQPPCTYTLDKTSQTHGPGSEQGSVKVTASDNDCRWGVGTAHSWIQTTQGPKTGSRTINYTLLPNPSPSNRTGTMTIAGQTFTVTQQPCTYTFNPSSLNVSHQSNTRSVQITTSQQSCHWSVDESVPWIDITSEKSGTGNGTITLRISQNNSTAERSFRINIRNAHLNIQQQGHVSAQEPPPPPPKPVSCTYKLSKISQIAGPNSSTGSFSVNSGNECTWTATSGTGWISIASGESGKGNGTVKFAVQPNTGFAARMGNISVEGQTFTVNQRGRSTGGPGKPQ